LQFCVCFHDSGIQFCCLPYYAAGCRFAKVLMMQYREFTGSLDRDTCPAGLEPCLRALWYDARGEWDVAHEIVQRLDTVMAARIHAYLHRKEGDDWNSRYWHRQAGSVFPAGMALAEEWDRLVRKLTE
jgi:hypothetical protein